MKNRAVLLIMKLVFVPLGFFGAVSFMQAVNSSFNRHMLRVAYAGWSNAGLELSVLWLSACLAVFIYSVWSTRHPKVRLPFSILRKVDYSLIVLMCGIGFYAGMNLLESEQTQFNLTFLPVACYALSILVLGELVARLRDGALLSTLYWLGFFKTYPVWRRPAGFFALLILASQIYVLSWNIVYTRLAALTAISALTYFAAFLVNISTQYEKVNEAKIKAERFKSELITNVSHDIKTPLTSIINYVDLLINEDLQGQAAEYAQVLDRKSKRLKTLIDDLMEASKAGTGNVRVDMREIDLGEIVGQVAGEFEDIFDKNNLNLVIRCPDVPVLIQADSHCLYRALENLFSNAAKYALSGTRIFAQIEKSSDSDRTRFTLKNTSQNPIDVEIADSEQLAEQFIRGDKSRQTEGSGLGLYIAKSLIELMDGKLNIDIIGDLFSVEIVL